MNIKILILSIVSLASAIFILNRTEPLEAFEGNDPIKKYNERLEEWQEGYLDIHHINTGSGDACFMVLPDGTTLLFDAGSLDKEAFEKNRFPLKVTSPVPNDSLSSAGWIADYIQKAHPHGTKAHIDYALISHFHGDHYGSLFELYKLLPIHNFVDRNYPSYNFPVDLRKVLSLDRTFQDYVALMDTGLVKAASLEVGRSDQVTLLNSPKKYPHFRITNVKANATIWTGTGENTIEYFTKEDMNQFYGPKFNENPLSIAIKVTYGDFDYFTGGDNTGLQGYGMPPWFDVETPIAKAVGKVEAMALNHHGNRDATNSFFVETLDPKVVVQQLWCSDHPGQEVYQRLIYDDGIMEERDLFSTNMHAETKVTYGPWFLENYKSTQGHVVIRVVDKGSKYFVYILDEGNLSVKQKNGPYSSGQ
ncbi:MAG: MBL fold metallo-hydrolase [Sediminicola sp.]